MKHTIDIEGLPEGWEPVAFRKPLIGEKIFQYGEIHKCTCKAEISSLIVKKKQPRRIVLEETSEENHLYESGQYAAFSVGEFVIAGTKNKWREVKDSGENKHMNMDNYSLEYLIKIHPRLCWVFDFGGKKYLKVVNKVVHGVNSSSHPTQYQVQGGGLYPDAMLASLESIKKYLHEVKEIDSSLTNEEPKLSLTVDECRNMSLSEINMKIIDFLKDK